MQNDSRDRLRFLTHRLNESLEQGTTLVNAAKTLCISVRTARYLLEVERLKKY